MYEKVCNCVIVGHMISMCEDACFLMLLIFKLLYGMKCETHLYLSWLSFLGKLQYHTKTMLEKKI